MGSSPRSVIFQPLRPSVTTFLHLSFLICRKATVHLSYPFSGWFCVSGSITEGRHLEKHRGLGNPVPARSFHIDGLEGTEQCPACPTHRYPLS